MTKMLKYTALYFLFVLSACSSLDHANRAPSSSHDARSCRKILSQVIQLSKYASQSDSSIETRAMLWEWLQNKTPLNASHNYSDLLKMNLSNDEIALFTKTLGDGELGNDRMNYALWASGQLTKKRERAFKELASWDKPEQTVELKKFLKARSKFDRWEEKRLKKLVADAGEDADQSALIKEAKRQRDSYERLKYACSAKKANSENASAGKNFRRFIMTVGPISTVAGYTVANWSELQEAWAQMQEGEGSSLKAWFKQLGYDLSIGLVLNYTLGRIFSEPTGTYLQKVAKGYGADLVIGVADMFAYNIIFPKDDKEVKKRFEELKKDPEFEEKMKLLQKRLDDVGFVVKFKGTVVGMIKDMLSKGSAMSLPKVGLLSLKPSDLDRPEVQKLVMQAIAAQLYEEGRYGAETPEWPQTIIHTGEGGSDRLFFYAGVGPLYHLLNIGIGAKIYQTICMGKDNLGSAYAKAAMMHTIWAFSYSLFEFPLRTNLIGQ